MQVKIKRIDTTLPLPEYKTAGACGFDLYSRETHIIQPKEIVLLPSNLIIETPPQHVLILAPRSSLARKKGLVMPNSVGVIDQDFSGDDDEILIMLQNITDTPVTVERGERIAQGLFLRVDQASWQEVATFKTISRGGFGTTGGYKE